MTRAVLEGVALGLRDNFELMKEVGLDLVQQVRVSGGGAKSPLWRQILADVCGVDLVTVQATEGAALGAALLAGMGTGVWSSATEACRAGVELGETTTPDGNAQALYDTSYGQFKAHYTALAPLFRD